MDLRHPNATASCRAVAHTVRILAKRGEPISRLVEGLPVTVATISDPRAWLPWDLFSRIVERLETVGGEPDAYLAQMRLLAREPLARSLRHALGLAASPAQLYTLVVSWLTPRLYPFVRSRIDRGQPGTPLTIVLDIAPELRGSEAFFRSMTALFRVLPRLLGLAEARVDADVGPHGGRYTVELPSSRSILARGTRLLRILAGSETVVEELLAQQEDLRASHEALAESYARLQEREERLRVESAERAAAEAALRASEERLREAHKLEAIGRLAGGIAHDFNNLMTAVLGYASLLRHELADRPKAAAHLEEICEAAGRAASLTAQLLAVGRRQPMELHPVDLNVVLGTLERRLERLLGPGVILRLERDPALGLTLADPSQVEQVIRSLAHNAGEAMGGHGTLLLRTEHVAPPAGASPGGAEAGEGLVRLTVRDTGPGMSPEIQARLFEPFFTTKALGDASGLGLAVVHGIVAQLGGDIRVESAPGTGATFVIDLPAVQPERAAAAGAAVAANGAATVAVVDDEPAVRRLMARQLETAGYHVLSAGDAGECFGLLAASESPVDVVIADVRLDGGSGVELAAQLRTRHPDIAVILSSGLPPGEAGGDADTTIFLPKPFSERTLVDTVRSALAARRTKAG